MNLVEKKGNFKVSREEWIATARRVLIERGIAGVTIENLAATLKVTRGGFYWFFKKRTDLLNELLKDWEITNTKPFFDAVENAGEDGLSQLKAFFSVWMTEQDFSPAYDTAIREWARHAPKARKVLERVDNARIELLTSIYKQMGYDDDEALIRGRVAYYHQIGYYSLGVTESPENRKRYLPIYTKILSGR